MEKPHLYYPIHEPAIHIPFRIAAAVLYMEHLQIDRCGLLLFASCIFWRKFFVPNVFHKLPGKHFFFWNQASRKNADSLLQPLLDFASYCKAGNVRLTENGN